MMAKGISLHVGINQVGLAFPNAARLEGCENDATAMHDLVKNHFTRSDLLLGPDASFAQVVAKFLNAANELEKGDLFLFTFAGHGTSEVDRDGDETDDKHDETILLYDILLYDDALRRDLWPLFKPGVRVLMISDSCHSGTVSSFEADDQLDTAIDIPFTLEVPVMTANGLRARTISEITRQRHLAEYMKFYERILVPLLTPTIQASVLLLAACPDEENTADGKPHGVFTQALLNVMRSTNPAQDYDELVDRIYDLLRPQTPQISVIPQDNPGFRAQAPFSI